MFQYEEDYVIAFLLLVGIPLLLWSLIEEAKKRKTKKWREKYNEGVMAQTRGNYDLAIANYKSALEEQTGSNKRESIPHFLLYSKIGLTYCEKQDQEKALYYLEKVLAMDQKKIEKKYGHILCAVHEEIGHIQFEKGNYDEAIAHYQQQRALTIATTNTQYEYPDTGNIHYNIGIVYLEQDDNDEALHHFQQGLFATKKKHGDEHKKNIDFYEMLTEVYTNKRNYEQATVAALQRLKLHKLHAHETSFIGFAYLALGRAYEKEKKYEQAIACYQYVLTKNKDLSKKLCAIFYNALGDAYFLQNKDEEAIRYYELTLVASIDEALKEELERVPKLIDMGRFHERFATTYQRQGLNEKAYLHYQKAYTLEKEKYNTPDQPIVKAITAKIASLKDAGVPKEQP